MLAIQLYGHCSIWSLHSNMNSWVKFKCALVSVVNGVSSAVFLHHIFFQLFSRSIYDTISMIFAYAIDQLADCSVFVNSGMVQWNPSLWSNINTIQMTLTSFRTCRVRFRNSCNVTLEAVEHLVWQSVWESLVLYQLAQVKSFVNPAICVYEKCLRVVDHSVYLGSKLFHGNFWTERSISAT